jgi:hypothetical protein
MLLGFMGLDCLCVRERDPDEERWAYEEGLAYRGR